MNTYTRTYRLQHVQPLSQGSSGTSWPFYEVAFRLVDSCVWLGGGADTLVFASAGLVSPLVTYATSSSTQVTYAHIPNQCSVDQTSLSHLPVGRCVDM